MIYMISCELQKCFLVYFSANSILLDKSYQISFEKESLETDITFKIANLHVITLNVNLKPTKNLNVLKTEHLQL